MYENPLDSSSTKHSDFDQSNQNTAVPAPLAFLHLLDALPRFGDDVQPPETAAVAVAAVAGAAGAKVADVVLASVVQERERDTGI